jgi:hypothetical protein
LTVEAKRNHRDVYEQQQFAFAHNIRTRTGE